MEAWGEEWIFVWYSNNNKAYWVFVLCTRTVIESVDVVIDDVIRVANIDIKFYTNHDVSDNPTQETDKEKNVAKVDDDT